MAGLQVTTSSPSSAGAHHSLHAREVLGRVSVSLAMAVVAPAVLLWVTMTLFDVTIAVVVALAWLAGAVAWNWATRRPVSGLLLLTLGILTMRTAFTLVTGNTYVYFVQPVFADLAVAALFLGSTWTARPVIARLAPDFFPMSAAIAASPEMRALFRRLTLMWGLVILVKGAITLWLLQSLSTDDFVLVKGGAIITLTLTAAVVTLVWSVVVGRQEGLLRSSPRGSRGRVRWAAETVADGSTGSLWPDRDRPGQRPREAGSGASSVSA